MGAESRGEQGAQESYHYSKAGVGDLGQQGWWSSQRRGIAGEPESCCADIPELISEDSESDDEDDEDIPLLELESDDDEFLELVWVDADGEEVALVDGDSEESDVPWVEPDSGEEDVPELGSESDDGNIPLWEVEPDGDGFSELVWVEEDGEEVALVGVDSGKGVVSRLEPDSDEGDMPDMESGSDDEMELGSELEGRCEGRRVAEKQDYANSFAFREDMQSVEATRPKVSTRKERQKEEGHIGDSGMAGRRQDAVSPVNRMDSQSGQVHTSIQNLPHTRVVAATVSTSSSSVQGSGSLREEESESGKAQEIFRTQQSQ